MKKDDWLEFILFLALSLALVGCRGVSPAPEATARVSVTAAEGPSIEKTASPTQTPTPTREPSPTPAMVEIELPIYQQLDCGDVFCQALWTGELIRPISGEYQDQIDLTYPYASTKGGALDVHHGVEFPNAFGTPVRAVADGEVVFAGVDDLTLLGPYTGFYGRVVILHHSEDFDGRDLFSLYAHLSELGVEQGEFLTAGQVLGKVGASGAADGSHLHFELRIDENDYTKTVNPLLWFAPTLNQAGARSAALAGQILDANGQPLPGFEFVLEQQGAEEHEPQSFYPVTYVSYGVNAHPDLQENFVLPDIPAGDYRLAFIAGRFYEFTFTLAPGSLGFIQVQLD